MVKEVKSIRVNDFTTISILSDGTVEIIRMEGDMYIPKDKVKQFIKEYQKLIKDKK